MPTTLVYQCLKCLEYVEKERFGKIARCTCGSTHLKYIGEKHD